MKECEILGGSKHTLTRPTYFPGVKTPNPRIYAHGRRPRSTAIRLSAFNGSWTKSYQFSQPQ